jgi:hypothetical protein
LRNSFKTTNSFARHFDADAIAGENCDFELTHIFVYQDTQRNTKNEDKLS